MRPRIGFSILSLLGLMTLTLWAHEGKVHVRGTLTAVDGQHIEVKTTEGKTKSIVITEKTVFQKKKEKVDRADLKIGSRVVVHATPGKNGVLTADEIHVGVMAREGIEPQKPDSKASKKPKPDYTH